MKRFNKKDKFQNFKIITDLTIGTEKKQQNRLIGTQNH